MLRKHLQTVLITLRYKKIILKYTNNEYDHFLCFFAAESESDIRFASSRLDLAVPELWIFAFLLKSENKFLILLDFAAVLRYLTQLVGE